MFLSTHPSPTLTMVISGAYPSHAALKHIKHRNHKELGWIRLEIKCFWFWFKHAIRLYNFSICRHWCQKRCLICDKRIMTKHSTYCARQMPNATWKNWKNRTEHYVVTRTVSWICIFCICCLRQCLPLSCPWEVGTMCPRGSSHPLWCSHIPKWENGFLMRADYPANLVILSNALDFTPSLSSLEVKS